MSTSKDIANRVAEELDISKTEAGRVVGAVFDKIAAALREGEKIQISGFGAFATKDLPARTGRNPATGEPVQIAASKKISFKASADMKRSL